MPSRLQPRWHCKLSVPHQRSFRSIRSIRLSYPNRKAHASIRKHGPKLTARFPPLVLTRSGSKGRRYFSSQPTAGSPSNNIITTLVVPLSRRKSKLVDWRLWIVACRQCLSRVACRLSSVFVACRVSSVFVACRLSSVFVACRVSSVLHF